MVYLCGVLLYYISDRRQFPGPESERRRRLLAKFAEAARCGVDFIQLREKDLCARDLELLAAEALGTVAAHGKSKLLINSRIDVALGVTAHGVHLTSKDISAADARRIWDAAWPGSGRPSQGCIGVSCHTVAEVKMAEAQGADFAVFAPVFQKAGEAGVGLEALRQVCTGRSMPVLALGGVTLENAASCIAGGAAGIAAIRLFQENDIAAVVASLRRPKLSS
jgi:thiamine-phosphate pyrophosphorylase